MNDREIEWAGRIAVLELEVRTMKQAQIETNQKLDELLLLRSKGMGAFWLASSVLGTGIVGAIFTLVAWMRG